MLNEDYKEMLQILLDKVSIEIDGLKVPFISKKNLIKNKRVTGREKDRIDADLLEEVD